MPHTNNGGGKSWRKDHDPFARPKGCHGKYGVSGVQRHRKAGTEPCEACRESYAHYKREARRGGIKPRTPKPCGTYAAAQRHKARKEKLCFKCRVAETNYRTELRNRTKEREAVPHGAASSIPTTKDQAA